MIEMHCAKCHCDLPNGGVMVKFEYFSDVMPVYCKECWFESFVEPHYRNDPDEIIDASGGEWITPRELEEELNWEEPGESIMRCEQDATRVALNQRY